MIDNSCDWLLACQTDGLNYSWPFFCTQKKTFAAFHMSDALVHDVAHPTPTGLKCLFLSSRRRRRTRFAPMNSVGWPRPPSHLWFHFPGWSKSTLTTLSQWTTHSYVHHQFARSAILFLFWEGVYNLWPNLKYHKQSRAEYLEVVPTEMIPKKKYWKMDKVFLPLSWWAEAYWTFCCTRKKTFAAFHMSDALVHDVAHPTPTGLKCLFLSSRRRRRTRFAPINSVGRPRPPSHLWFHFPGWSKKHIDNLDPMDNSFLCTSSICS